MKALFRKKQPTQLPGKLNSRAGSSSQVDLSKLDLNKEIDRQISFTRNGWDVVEISYQRLALFGFYFYKRPDHVRCKFCRLTLSNFEPGDCPLVEHLKFSRNCPLILRRPTANVAINFEQLNEELPEISYDCSPSSDSDEDENEVEVDQKTKTKKVQHPEFILENTRLSSFEDWPKGLNQKPKDLASAGFFYGGKGDNVICFHCGIGLKDWEPEDNVWLEHEKYMPTCGFLQLNTEILEENRKNPRKMSVQKMDDETFHDSELCDKESPNDNCCKICFIRRANLVFLPCKHVVSCGNCVFGLNDICPICREPIKEKISVYFS